MPWYCPEVWHVFDFDLTLSFSPWVLGCSQIGGVHVSTVDRSGRCIVTLRRGLGLTTHQGLFLFIFHAWKGLEVPFGVHSESTTRCEVLQNSHLKVSCRPISLVFGSSKCVHRFRPVTGRGTVRSRLDRCRTRSFLSLCPRRSCAGVLCSVCLPWLLYRVHLPRHLPLSALHPPTWPGGKP